MGLNVPISDSGIGDDPGVATASLGNVPEVQAVVAAAAAAAVAGELNHSINLIV